MIDWRPMAEMTDALRDGRDVLFAVPNRLGGAQGSDGAAPHPERLYLFSIAQWSMDAACWIGQDETEWLAEELSHFAELAGPTVTVIFRQNAGQLAEQLGFVSRDAAE